MKRMILIIGIAVILSLNIANADVPHLISYQGILKDSTGEVVEDNIYALKFSIYDSDNDGNLLWQSNGFVPIQTTNGIFNHVLGSTNPIPDSICRFSSLWLGITVDLDQELPRVQIVSVPFSLTAQYADTAAISLDKTVNANDLIAGTLDTARYSAYEDLITEGKIGEGTDQVAAGDHTHSITSYPGAMSRYKENSSVTILVPANDTTVKSLQIPSGTISDFFRITVHASLYCVNFDGGYLNFSIVANGQTLFSYPYFIGGNNTRLYSFQLDCNKLYDNEWTIYAESECNPNGPHISTIEQANLVPHSGVNLEIHVNGPVGLTLTIGNLIVEYDVD